MITAFLKRFGVYYRNSGVHSMAVSIHDWIANGWAGSMFGRVFSNDRTDENCQSSMAYKILTSPLVLWNKIAAKLPSSYSELTETSFVFRHIKNLMANVISLNSAFFGGFLAVSMLLMTILTPRDGLFMFARLAICAAGIILLLINRPLTGCLRDSLLFKLAQSALGGEIEMDYLESIKGKNGMLLGIIYGAVVAVIGYCINLNVLAVAAFIALIGVLLILWKYEAGVFILVFVAPFLPTMVCVGLALLCLVSYIIRCVVDKRPFIKLDSVSFLIAGFIVLLLLYSLTSLSIKKSSEIFLVYFAFLAVYFLIITVATNKKRLYWICSVFVTAGLLVSLYGIYQQFFGKGLDNVWVDQDMFEEISVRVYSTLENPNVLGEYLLLVIPLCMAMVWACKGFFAKLYYSGVFAASSLCLVFTQSRGCWVGIMVGFLVYILFINKKYLALLFVGLLAAPFILPTSILERFFSIGNVQDSSTSYRVSIWLGSMAMLADFWPFGIGIGQQAFNKVYTFYSYSRIYAPHTHNIYLQLLTETGIVGLLTVLTCFVVFWRKMATVIGKVGKTANTVICVAVLAATLSFMVQGAFDYVWYNYRVFLMFWIVIGLGVAARKAALLEVPND